MLRDTSNYTETAGDPGDLFGFANVPAKHSADPFACPCCANVFSEILRLTGVDAAVDAGRLRRAAAVATPPAFITNATIITMNARAPAADSLCVRDGKIVWVGESKDKPELDEAVEEIDLGGKVVLPGFIEPHMHLAPLAMLQSFENVGPFRFPTIDSAIEHLRGVADRASEGAWVLGRQFDPSLQEGPDELTRDMLDEVSTEHPVFVYNASLHLGYCNTKALAIAGITADTEDPPGAEIGRDENDEPNGVLKAGPAMALVARHNPHLKEQNLAESCLRVFEDANRVGLTMLADQGTGLFQGVKELDLYRGLRDSNRMTARFRYSVGQAIADRWDETDIAWGQGDEWVRVTGWKIVSDGSNQGRTGLQREAFVDSQDTGIAYISVEELNEAVAQRLDQGWAVCVHANGDLAIDRALDAYERAQALGLDPGSMRCRIEHCSILYDEHVERMARLGISPSFLIGHVYYWGKAFVDDVFGLAKASKLDRTGTCEDRGIRWTIHSDDPVTEMGPLRCVENAVTRTMWKSDALLSPEERVPVEAALRAVTIDAAWQCHSDHEVGSLEAGKFADFVVLDEDPREVEPTTISAIRVLETWVDGRRVFAS
jgi:predicted amidohydrolase YtcJ